MLAISDLHVAYGQSEVLHGLNVSVAPNEIVAIMGRNGMGKTTLMKSLMGILPTKSGSVSMERRRAQRAAELRARRQGPRLCAAGPHDLLDHDGEGEHRDRPRGVGRVPKCLKTSTNCSRCCWR